MQLREVGNWVDVFLFCVLFVLCQAEEETKRRNHIFGCSAQNQVCVDVIPTGVTVLILFIDHMPQTNKIQRKWKEWRNETKVNFSEMSNIRNILHVFISNEIDCLAAAQ